MIKAYCRHFGLITDNGFSWKGLGKFSFQWAVITAIFCFSFRSAPGKNLGEYPLLVLGLALFCTAACHAACKFVYHGSIRCVDRLEGQGAGTAILYTLLILGFALAIYSIPMWVIKAASLLAPQTVVFAGYNTAFLCGMAMHCADAVIADLTGFRLMAGKAER